MPAKTTLHTETHWALAGRWSNGRPFFYFGTYLTRKAAIDDAESRSGETWRTLYRRGERAIKVTVTGRVP